MREKGFLPFTSVGLVLLILAVMTVGYYHWSSHQDRMSSIHDYSASSLSTSIGTAERDMKSQLKEDFHNSLWIIGENAYQYENNRDREAIIKTLMRYQFRIRHLYLHQRQKKIFSEPEWRINGLENLYMNRGEGGYPIFTANLSPGSYLFENQPDNSISIKIPIDRIKTSLDVRYYLLQDRMNQFSEGFGCVERRWAFAEYALAYLDVWGRKKLKLSESRTKALFNLALVSHEIDKFGSTDYIDIATDLAGIDISENMMKSENSDTTIKPLKKRQIRKVKKKIRNAIFELGKSKSILKKSLRQLKKIKKFSPQNWKDKKHDQLKNIKENITNADIEKLESKFRKICKECKKIYIFPKNKTKKAIEGIKQAINCVKKSKKHFKESIQLLEKFGKKNPLMKQLHENFTQNGNPPGISKQVHIGISNVKHELSNFQKRLEKIRNLLKPSLTISKTFPDSFAEKFSKAAREENKKIAIEIIDDALKSADIAFRNFKKEIDKGLVRINEYYSNYSDTIDRQTKKPQPNWRKDYTKYSDPGEEHSSHNKVAKKFVIYDGKGTIGGLLKLLKNVNSQLDSVITLSDKFEKQRQKLKEFDINDELKDRLMEKAGVSLPIDISREKYYELSPPKPLFSDPGLSVYHDFEIENIEFERFDPVGIMTGGHVPYPTPVYLWFINTTLYWTSWEITISLEGPIVEEIYDYKNKVIPKETDEGSREFPKYVNQPLPFKQKFEKTEYNFHLATISLRPYTINKPKKD
ncbi:hypothetical protein AKJ52_01905 [candidate division MSBL1 archaeon SCGC-AAA382C18]|uniref:Uncharacterized protein n=1 Tax=candidate division MSBL1 archaeon SCGC-AAA382C18 TaxID=1698281 RepID=A0A133VJL4_9EURY|nr:hypothetical protein AKJ52_01905 [candidate division MSBL1 archaeon SCGC-AAA382C18]